MHTRADSTPKARRGGRRQKEEGSLIDWQDPDRNINVLDWRRRAHGFGLVPVESPDEDVEDADGVIDAPERLVNEEEPEAFEQQDVEAFRRPNVTRKELDDAPGAGVPDAEVDLVRTYLAHIGRRKLLTGREEQEIGRRLEQARADLLAAIGAIPSALETLLALAANVRQGSAPPAELILLADGGELKPDRVQPVLDALDRVASHHTSVRAWQ